MAGRTSTPRRIRIETFVLASGTFSILAVPLLYLALRSVRDARHLRAIHGELAVVMRETKELAEQLHALQHEIRHEQRETRPTSARPGEPSSR